MDIFVGNLSFSSTEDSLRELFAPYGEVTSVRIILSRETRRSRGFGFVEMPDEAEARAAIAELDGTQLDGRPLKVSEAKPKTDRSASSGRSRW